MKKFAQNMVRNRWFYIIIAFIVYSLFASSVPYYQFDLSVTKTIQSINLWLFEKIIWFVSILGNPHNMVWVIGITSLFMFFRNLKKEAIFSSLSAASGAVIGMLIKILVDRPRPAPDTVNVLVWFSDKSYPSNHVLVFTIYFGFLLYLLLSKTLRKSKENFLVLVFALLIASIGISRIYLGAHWASDVLGGYVLGIIWLKLTISVYNSHNGKG